MTRILVANTGSESGKTGTLAQFLKAQFEGSAQDAEVLHLDDLKLPVCDGKRCYADPTVQELGTKVAAADAILIVAPVYNYQLNAGTKNFVELTNNGWSGKVVGIACHGGGDKSYLAPLSLIGSLLVDHRCHIVPRFVYSTRDAFDPDNRLIPDHNVARRMEKLSHETIHLLRALASVA